ncbi:hypothetical protein ACFFRR_005295 [Megaselia abdita]
MNFWKGKLLAEVPFGHVLILSGKIKPNPNKITLDLTDNIKENKEADIILLKIEANFRENQIIRSMYQPGEGWMKEEISKNWKNGTPKNPLVPGDIFHFRVAVLQKCFEIYVNDKLYGTFEHLECPKKINYALVTGDFEKITQFHHRMLFPLVFPRCLTSSCSEKLCFQSDVPQKYEAGTVVTLEGLSSGPPTSNFSICFQCNDTGRILLKFLVDFNRKSVIRSFQREDKCFNSNDVETSGEFVFQRGRVFKIAFGLSDKAFLIAINGQFFTYFNFPMQEFSISTIKCYCNDISDFSITNIEYLADTALVNRVEKLSILD